jgi:polysaccharide pyruvyl transferase WcaK-like protein
MEIENFYSLKKNKSKEMNENKPTLNFIVKGSYGEGNFGDDALMVCLNNLLSRYFKGASIKYLCNKLEYSLEGINHRKDFLKFTPKKSENTILIYGGGTQFFSFKKSKFQLIINFILRIFRIAKMLLSEPNKFFLKIKENFFEKNKSIFKYQAALGIGFGPFESEDSEYIITQKKIKEISFIGVRDIYSYEFCKNIKCEGMELYADLCFHSDFYRKYIPKKTVCQSKNIGIIVRDWVHNFLINKTYSNSILKVASELRSDGFNVTFILFGGSQDLGWKNCLLKMHENALIWDPTDSNMSNFINELNNFDLFISARYHGAVFSTLLGKPVVCVDIEQKLSLYAGLLGDGGALWSHPFAPQDCVVDVKRLLGDITKSRNAIDQLRIEQSHLADKMINNFTDFFNKFNVNL